MAKKATKKPAKTTKKEAVGGVLALKALRPKNMGETEVKVWGHEPLFEKQPVDNRLSVLCNSLSWYGRFFVRKNAKPLMVQYLDLNNRKNDAKLVGRVEDSEFRITFCWLARLSLRGLELTKDESTRLEEDIQRLIAIAKMKAQKKEKVAVSNAPNVQERMRAKAAEAGGDLEGMLDEYIQSGAKANHGLRPIEALSKHNVMAQHVSTLVDAWKKHQAEFEEVLAGKDDQLVEAYSFLNRVQVKNIIKFAESVQSDLNSYVSMKKAAKAPRKRKAVPVEKIVKRLKHVMAFKDPANGLDLTGMSPTKIHGASEAYLYDTKKRKLIYLAADSYSKCLSVKGSTILGFDTKTSGKKTLRRPKEQLTEFLKLGRPAMRKYFDAIRGVSVTPKGRTNKDMLILKAH